MRSLSLRVAVRYLLSPKSHSAVNVISLVAVAGVAVATMAIVCVLSVFNGFADVAAQRLSVFDPQLKVTPIHGKTIADADEMALTVRRAAPGAVHAVAPTIEEHALSIYDGRQKAVRIKGVDSVYHHVTDITPVIIDGEFLPEGDDLGYPTATLGVGAAIDLQAHPGYYDWLRIYVPQRTGRINQANPMASFRADSLVVSGVFQLNQTEYDNDLILVPYEVARHLLDYTSEASALEVSLLPGADAASAARAISEALGPDFRVAGRMEQQAHTYRMIQVEKWVTMLLLVFILVIASFNIISTMSMLIIEKRSDIATYSAIGATRGFIGRIFRDQGMLVTCSGASAGLVLGVALCLLQQHFGFLKLSGDPSQLSITEYPVKIHILDLAAVALAAFGVAFGVGMVARAMAMPRRSAAAAVTMTSMLLLMPGAAGAKTPIFGAADIDAATLCQFVRQHNADFPYEIAESFVTVGARYGIRYDIAFCQAIVETGWFKYTGGTAVKPHHNNFCGLGVVKLGKSGSQFKTVADGVTAHMQHLFAYASRKSLPDGESLIDPRFGMVRRGCATHWEDLSGRWAANKHYGRDILRVYERLRKFSPAEVELAVASPVDSVAPLPAPETAKAPPAKAPAPLPIAFGDDDDDGGIPYYPY